MAALRCFPSVVEFQGIEEGTLYVLTLSIQNVAAGVRRIRFIPPTSGAFTLNHCPSVAVASGLEVRAEIEFQAQELRDYSDKLVVISDDDRLEVPLRAFVPAPRIAFDGFVDLGTIVADNTASYYVDICNEGLLDGSFKVVYDSKLPLTITPREGVIRGRAGRADDAALAAGRTVASLDHCHTCRVKVELHPKILGVFRTVAEVHISGKNGTKGAGDASDVENDVRVLDINANVVEQRLSLVVPGGGAALTEAPFGTVFYGQRETMPGLLVNSGPSACNFQVVLSPERGFESLLAGSQDEHGDQSRFVASEQRGNEARDNAVTVGDGQVPAALAATSAVSESLVAAGALSPILVLPMEGVIQPYSQQELTFVFQPRAPEHKKGFKTAVQNDPEAAEFVLGANVECVETKQRLCVNITGKALKPTVSLSQRIFRFGDCEVNGRRDIRLKIENKSDELPVDFVINKVAFFCAHPSRGRLLPSQWQEIVLTFRPGQLGKFKNTLHFVISKGIVTVPLRVSGVSTKCGQRKKKVGGPHALATDFKPTFRYVTPQDLTTKPPARPRGDNTNIGGLHGDSETSRKSSEIFNVTNEALYTFSDEELRRKQAHKEKYNRFLAGLRDERAKKAAKRAARRHGTGMAGDPHGVDIGIDPRSGLDEPFLRIPNHVDPLWLEHPLDPDGADGGVVHKRSRVKGDENRLIKKKFKSKPSTQAESRDCKASLSVADLSSVVTGPKVMKFGTVCVNSTSTKNFAVTNDLGANVLVQVMSGEHEELSRSTPGSQVVPPGATAGFDISFCSRTQPPDGSSQAFRKTVAYIINEVHHFKFTVCAEVVPITVQLSHDDLLLRFPDDYTEPFVTEVVTISNPGNATALFSWHRVSADQALRDNVIAASDEGGSSVPPAGPSAFSVTPMSGDIGPFKSLNVDVTFSPAIGLANEDILVLKVVGGSAEHLPVVGEVDEPKCVFVEKKVDFGPVAVGLSRERVVVVKNTGSCQAIFYTDATADGLSVSPSQGRIVVGQTVDLIITMKPPAARVYNSDATAIVLSLRGGKTVRLPVEAVAVVPDVGIREEEFEFGGVTIGASGRKMVTIENSGDIPATMFLDLSSHSEFHVSMPERTDSQAERDEAESVFVPVTETRLTRERIRGTPQKRSLEASEEGKAHEDDGASGVGREGCHKFKLLVKPKSTLQFILQYTPTAEAQHAFELPLTLAGMPLSPALRRLVGAEGLRPRLLLSSTHVDFDSKVVARDRVKKIPYHMTVRVTNRDDEMLQWEVGTAALQIPGSSARGTKISTPHQVFSIKPHAGNLESGDSCDLRVSFLPDDEEEYSASLPLYLDGQRDRPYLELSLHGVGMFPSLAFNRHELIFPTVPIGIRSCVRFSVINHGYDNLELKYRLPMDSNRVPLSIRFPEGTNLGIAKERIPVEVVFFSRKAMSFTAQIDFFDGDSNKFSIPISGTADNCLLTSYAFVSAYCGISCDFYARPGRPIMLADHKTLRQLEQQDATMTKGTRRGPGTSTKQLKGGPFQEESTFAAAIDDAYLDACVLPSKSIRLLVKWLNATILRAPLSQLPDDAISAHGKPILDMIETLAGRSVPGRVSKLSQNRRESFDQLCSQYGEMLTFLKSHGALLHHIRPAHLLSCDNYTRMMTVDDLSRLTPAQLLQRRQALEKEHAQLSRAAWGTIVLQCIKVFVLSRLTLRQFKSLPGVDPARGGSASAMEALNLFSPRSGGALGKKKKNANSSLSGSNIYSVAENLLLHWVSLHNKRGSMAKNGSVGEVEGTIKRFANFDVDLSDGSALCNVILSHIPTLMLPGRALAGVHQSPETLEECESNVRKAMDALRELGLDFSMDAMAVLEPDPRDMLLFVLFLYQNLPQFIPKTEVEFFGTLGARVVKTIELRNPSKRLVNYRVYLEGSADFKIQCKHLRLDPHSSIAFPVEFVSRFSKPVAARLTFKAVRDGGATASTMVFLLRSAVHSRRAVRTIKVDARCYEPAIAEVVVTNPFKSECQFQITLSQEFLDGVSAAKGGKRKGDGTRRRSRPGVESAASSNAITSSTSEKFPDPFWTKLVTLKMRGGASTPMPVQFLPFRPGEYRCDIVLLDENVGEFLYEVLGTAVLPAPTDRIEFKCEVKAQVQKDLLLPTRNVLLDRARNLAIERLSGAVKARARDALKAMDAADKPPSSYKARFNSPYFTSPPEVLIAPSGLRAPGGSKGSAGGKDKATLSTPRVAVDVSTPNVLSIAFHPKAAGIYPCQLILKSPWDIRVIEFEGTVVSPGVETTLEFQAPARQTISQEIPIVNKSNRDWTLSANLSGSSAFSGPRSLNVPKGGSAKYTLSFKPMWVSEETALLVLSNGQTGERMQYHLKGTGEEPLAEDHVVIHCQARDRLKHCFTIRNGRNAEVAYDVQSDLPHVSGSSSVTVPPGRDMDYELLLHPLLGGTYTGSITFIAPSGEYIWYTVEVIVSSPEPEGSLDISTFVRKAAAVEITLANPLDQRVEFEVLLDGEGLLGDLSFVLDARESGVYELLYSPLVPGLQHGSVSFQNQLVGEVWYRLVLDALPAPAVQLDEMACAVGSRASLSITLENPTGEEVDLMSQVTNRRNFSVLPAHVVLGAYGKADVLVEYTPSSLREVERACVTFAHPRLGEWAFEASGRGTPPSTMDPVVITAAIGQNVSSMFNFRNPFPSSLTVAVTLVDENGGQSDAFALLLKRARVQIAGFGNLQVPLSFSPREIKEQKTTIIVHASPGDNTGGLDNMTWTFPVHGIAEAPPSNKVFSFECRSRERLEDVIEIYLEGLPDSLQKPEVFSHELVIAEENKALVERALRITASGDCTLTDPGHPLRYDVVFEPLRPFSAHFELIVNKQSGGRWRFDVQVDATEPDVDDEITIEAMLNRTSSVSFKLTNQFASYAHFEASFTPDSPYEFAVFPTSGVLEPYGEQDGTTFIVSFTPTEYGKTLVGKLLIHTDDMQWTYLIRGTHPKYQAPTVNAVVSSKLPKKFMPRPMAQGKPRNILRENMKATLSTGTP